MFDASVPVSADGATGVWWRESFPSRKISGGWTILDIRHPDLRPKTWLPSALVPDGWKRRRIALIRAFEGQLTINLTTWADNTQRAIDVRASLSEATPRATRWVFRYRGKTSIVSLSADADGEDPYIVTDLPASWAGLIAALEAQAPDAAHPVDLAIVDASSPLFRASDVSVLLPPARPTGLAAVAGDGRVTLSWDDPGIATLAGWQVQTRAVGGDRGDWTDVAGSDQGTTGHTVTGLRNGRAGAFRLRMVGAGGPGAASDEVAATPERIITPAERYALAQRAASPGDAVVACLEIRHPELGDAAVRVVNDAIDLELGGRRYAALRFDARLADDVEGRQPAAELWIDNIGRDLTQWIEAAGGGAGATVRVMQCVRATRSHRVGDDAGRAPRPRRPGAGDGQAGLRSAPGQTGRAHAPRPPDLAGALLTSLDGGRPLRSLACALRATRGARSRAPGRCAARPRTGAMTVTPHWSGRYIGRAHVEGAHDCADFVADVLREEFGRVWAPPPRAHAVRGRDAQIAALAADHARPLGAGETPEEGDGVLMRMAGRRRLAGHHIGLWCAPAGEPSVLHCQAGLGTVLHPLRGLEARGLEPAGIYRWTTRT